MMMKISHMRETGVENVRKLLSNLPEHDAYPTDAIRMVDRVIGGLLAHPKSPYVKDYRSHAVALFPSGLEATRPGVDIILILNQTHAYVLKNGSLHKLEIPRALKHPEKGVAQIVGRQLALALFEARGKILARLAKNEPRWDENLAANHVALRVLSYYDPEGSSLTNLSVFSDRAHPYKMKKLETDAEEALPRSQKPWWSLLCPCID